MKVVPFRACVVSVVAGVALSVTACGSKEKAPEVQQLEISVVDIGKKDVVLSSEFVGRTKGAIDAEVRARVEGVLEEIHFQDGGDVTEGQLLYSIDDAPLLTKVAQAKGNLSEALTRQTQADIDLKRIRPLADINAVSKRELDGAIGRKGVADGAVDAAKAQVQAAEIELGYAQIKAPTSGLIGITKFKVGELVGKGPDTSVLNTVSKIDPIHAKFPVSEKEYLYFSRLAEEQGPNREKRVLQLILADGTVHPELGELVSVDRNIDAQTGAISVEVSFPNPTKRIRPGMFAKVKTIAETRKDVLVVPKRALKEMQGKYQVFVIAADGSVEPRNVEVGADAGDSRVVESGLSEHELVAVDGIQRLRSGMTVKAKTVS
jgi:membrane fusion protein (multidrug efflux system)